MKCYMTGQEKGFTFNTGDCLKEVTTWACLTVHTIKLRNSEHL